MKLIDIDLEEQSKCLYLDCIYNDSQIHLVVSLDTAKIIYLNLDKLTLTIINSLKIQQHKYSVWTTSFFQNSQ